MEEGELVMLCLWYITLALIYGSLLFMIFSELLGCFRQWRSRRDAELAADRLLESVPDVSYQQLPGQECCVVCMEEYEHGERCFVMPGCAHMQHHLPSLQSIPCRRSAGTTLLYYHA
ncbi:hypothetical protein HU200_030621 [Digitaria exilis]|uniref:RING-type domain-containing protein n=1 Tax=Digitaria exilis TaxID=1010633 RepID=A0A835EQH4_9POAL|nr:hypothetical protein HU200_030621 [Digitaria exilis]